MEMYPIHEHTARHDPQRKEKKEKKEKNHISTWSLNGKQIVLDAFKSITPRRTKGETEGQLGHGKGAP